MNPFRYLWWQIRPPMAVVVSRRLHREFAGLAEGSRFLRVHWRTLSPDVVEFLRLEGIAP